MGAEPDIEHLNLMVFGDCLFILIPESTFFRSQQSDDGTNPIGMDDGIQTGNRKLGTAVNLVFNHREKAGVQGNMPPDSTTDGHGDNNRPQSIYGCAGSVFSLLGSAPIENGFHYHKNNSTIQMSAGVKDIC